MARITRKELKSDKFALEVEHTVSFFEEHKTLILRYGAIAAAIALLVVGYNSYSGRQRTARQDALASAIEAQQATVGPAAQGVLSFPTEQAKDQEVEKRLNAIINKYSGSQEATIALYYLGSMKADQGKMAEAEKDLLAAADKGDARYSSLAKLSLAQIYFADGRADQGEKMLRDLINNPTIFVSKDHATIALARQLMVKKPAEARKLLEPLLKKTGPTGQLASNLNSQISQ